MEPWLWWVIAAAVLIGLEVVSGTLVLAMVGAGALAAAGVAAAGGDTWLQVAAFAGVGVLMVAVVRPVAKRHLHQPRELRTGAAALVGEYAVVLADTDADGGRVRIGSDVWSARAYDGATVYPAGERVQVLQIEGATALIG
jgi:membrane protein implicated in regulation of membrane protease activity